MEIIHKEPAVGQWKWIDSAKGKGLYDLEHDVGEAHDLSLEKPEIVSMIQNRFNLWRNEMDACEPRGPFRNY